MLGQIFEERRLKGIEMCGGNFPIPNDVEFEFNLLEARPDMLHALQYCELNFPALALAGS